MKYLFPFAFLFLITITFNSCITSCDCIGTESLYVNLYDAQTGTQLSIYNDSTAYIEILDEPEKSFEIDKEQGTFEMTLNPDYSDLCSDQQLIFNVHYQNQVV